MCGEKFSSENVLKKHTETKHAPGNEANEEEDGVQVTYYCDHPDCDKTSTSKKGLSLHKTRAHRNKSEEVAEATANETIEISTDGSEADEKPNEVDEKIEEVITEVVSVQPSTKALADMMEDWMDE